MDNNKNKKVVKYNKKSIIFSIIVLIICLVVGIIAGKALFDLVNG